MKKTIIFSLLSSLFLFGCGDKTKVSSLPSSTVAESVTVEKEDVKKFSPKNLRAIVLKISSFEEQKFLSLTNDEKFLLLKEVYVSFDAMALDDYYMYSPDQPDKMSGGRGYSKEDATKYTERLSKISIDLSSVLTESQQKEISDLQMDVPYMKDISLQNEMKSFYEKTLGIKNKVSSILLSGEIDIPKEKLSDLGNDDQIFGESKKVFNEWKIEERGIIQFLLSESYGKNAVLTMIPVKRNKVVEWRCSISPPQSNKFYPNACQSI